MYNKLYEINISKLVYRSYFQRNVTFRTRANLVLKSLGQNSKISLNKKNAKFNNDNSNSKQPNSSIRGIDNKPNLARVM